MKKNVLSFMTLLLLLINISCSDDEDKFKIIAADAEFHIDENPQPGDLIGKINITSESDDLVYNILKSSYWNSFSVNSNGEIIVKQNTAFDYEHNQLILGVIHVSNQKQSDESHIMIFINDVNEIYAENFVMTMDEGVSENQSLGFLQARADQGSMNFELLSQTPENAVSIDAETGEVLVNDPSLFAYDLNSSISGMVKISNDESEKEVLFSINLNKIVVPEEPQEPVETAPGVLTGVVTITTQTELDEFVKNNYHTIQGDLIIDEDPEGEGIVSLEGLESLLEIQGSLIIRNTNSITNLKGLEGLSIVYQLYIQNNMELSNLDALSGIENAAIIIITDNILLKNFCPLQELLKNNSFQDAPGYYNKGFTIPPLPPKSFGASGNMLNPTVAEVLELDCN